MIKVLIDTNVVLDIALKREPFFKKSAQIFKLIDQKLIIGYISATSITDLYYIAKKSKGGNQSKAFLTDLIKTVEILGVDKQIIEDALNSQLKDFEDAVQTVAAEHNKVGVIVTRNVKDFQDSPLKVLSPEALIEEF